jgi:hypothetical protein
MSGKVLLLYVKETGHVLAALTVAADLGEDVKAEALAGAALSVRYASALPISLGPTKIFVAADQLLVMTADYDADIMADPRAFFVEEVDGQKKVSPLDQLTAVTAANQGFTQVRVSEASPGTVADEVKVWIQLAGPDPEDVQVATGKFTGGVANVNVKALKPGTPYMVLLLVAGLRVMTIEITP